MASPTDRTLAAYEQAAGAYFAASQRDVSPVVAHLLRTFAERIPGGDVLEIGSGPGLEATYLEELGLTVARTDAVSAFVERLRQAGHEARLLDVRTDDLGGPYDGVLAHAVFLHLDRHDARKALIACRNATRPGGVLALTLKEGDGEAWSDAKIGRPRWFVYWRGSQIREVLEQIGWQVLCLDRVQGRLEPWLHVLCRK